MSGSFQFGSVDRTALRAIANSLPSAVVGNSCSSKCSVQQNPSPPELSQWGDCDTFCASPNPSPRSCAVNTTTGAVDSTIEPVRSPLYCAAIVMHWKMSTCGCQVSKLATSYLLSTTVTGVPGSVCGITRPESPPDGAIRCVGVSVTCVPSSTPTTVIAVWSGMPGMLPGPGGGPHGFAVGNPTTV